jgi:uncharacterized protein YbaR (Trm112 family)
MGCKGILHKVVTERARARCYSSRVCPLPAEAPMPVDAELLEILACPSCKTPVKLVKNGTALKCDQCHRVYPIKDDIPVMLIDEATIEP